MTVRELWSRLMTDYAVALDWLPAELAGANVTATVVEGTTTLTVATGSRWLPWLQAKLSHSASRKATAIAGRRVMVEFVEVEG